MTNSSVGMGEQDKAGHTTIKKNSQNMLKASKDAGIVRATGSLAFSMPISFHWKKAG